MYMVGLCPNEEARFLGEIIPVGKWQSHVGLNPEFFLLDEVLANLSVEDQMVNVLDFVGHTVSAAAIQFSS